MKLLYTACLVLCLLLSGCNYHQHVSVVAFLSLDGNSISEHPYSDTVQYEVSWKERPTWTALPVVVSGDIEGSVITNATLKPYDYVAGTNKVADAYYTVITKGDQSNFEIIWTEVYNKLNGEETCTYIDGTPIATSLEHVSSKDEYGDMLNILTDALVLIKNINTNGPLQDYNKQAEEIYNRYYSWLNNFSVTYLEKTN